MIKLAIAPMMALLFVSILLTIVASPQTIDENGVKWEWNEEEQQLIPDRFNPLTNCYQGGGLKVGKSGVPEERRRWTDAIVPVTFDPKFNADDVSRIQAGLDEISSKSCLKFVRRTDAHKNYVHIEKGDTWNDCWSQLGMLGGKQTVMMSSYCVKNNVTAHELIHTLGFWHEHQRPDRDDYIHVIWENIVDNYGSSFIKMNHTVTFGVPYDFDSVMHYPGYPSKGARRGEPCMVSKIPGKTIPDYPPRRLSLLDFEKINRMYKCP